MVLVSHLNSCHVAPSPSCPVWPGRDPVTWEDSLAHTSPGDESSHQSSQVEGRGQGSDSLANQLLFAADMVLSSFSKLSVVDRFVSFLSEFV